MNIFNKLRNDIIYATEQIIDDQEVLNAASIEIPKDKLNGDLSCNIAMIVASKQNVNPKDVANKIVKELLSHHAYIASIEVAGPGFINFTIRADYWHNSIKEILSDDKDFFKIDIGKNLKVNIEYVSANPTGPMHIGHARVRSLW